jgi:hypothetical protein
VGAFCDARARAECNDLVVTKCKAASKEACVKTRTELCMKAVPQGTRYVPTFASACVVAVRDMLADAKIQVAEQRLVDQSCGAKIFSGPGAAREPCDNDYDCSSADGLVCFLPSNGDGRGKCLKPTPVASDQSCANESDRCAADQFCEEASKTCQTRATVGAYCHATMKPWMIGLRCPPANPFTTMVCQKGSSPGQLCRLDADRDEGVCVKSPMQSEGSCASELELSPIASACAQLK